MMMADPLVKPLMTLWDRKLVRKPRCARPAARNMNPAIKLICISHPGSHQVASGPLTCSGNPDGAGKMLLMLEDQRLAFPCYISWKD